MQHITSNQHLTIPLPIPLPLPSVLTLTLTIIITIIITPPRSLRGKPHPDIAQARQHLALLRQPRLQDRHLRPLLVHAPPHVGQGLDLGSRPLEPVLERVRCGWYLLKTQLSLLLLP